MTRVAIIGIGNILMGDDGAGVKVLELLPDNLPEGVFTIELATGGMTLLHKFEGLDMAIICDAVDFGGKPGEIRVFQPHEVESIKTLGYSLHDIDILKVLEIAKKMNTIPKQVFIVAIQPANIDFSEELSLKVQASLPELASKVMELVNK